MEYITYLLDIGEEQRAKEKNYRKQNKQTQKKEKEFPDIKTYKYSHFHCLS